MKSIWKGILFRTERKVQNYIEYTRLLKEFILKNEKVELSEKQILHFISENRLDSDWGITLSDVQEDMATIIDDLQRKEKAKILIEDNPIHGLLLGFK